MCRVIEETSSSRDRSQAAQEEALLEGVCPLSLCVRVTHCHVMYLYMCMDVWQALDASKVGQNSLWADENDADIMLDEDEFNKLFVDRFARLHTYVYAYIQFTLVYNFKHMLDRIIHLYIHAYFFHIIHTYILHIHYIHTFI